MIVKSLLKSSLQHPVSNFSLKIPKNIFFLPFPVDLVFRPNLGAKL
jgi:hypothetical protein